MQPPDIDTKPLSSGEAAKRTGTSTDTLRHYEKLGLLSNIGRTAAGYRLYSAASIERINLIRSSLGLGFSLRELNGILRVRDKGGAPCQKVRAMLVEKVTALDQQIEQLIETYTLQDV